MTRLVEFFTALLHRDMQRKIPLPEPFFFTILHQKVNPLKLQSWSKLVETLHFFERVMSSFHYVAFLYFF